MAVFHHEFDEKFVGEAHMGENVCFSAMQAEFDRIATLFRAKIRHRAKNYVAPSPILDDDALDDSSFMWWFLTVKCMRHARERNRSRTRTLLPAVRKQLEDTYGAPANLAQHM